jgi:DnaJ-class molecular chaperone
MDVSIERGMPDGENIVFEGASDHSPDHSPGDIRFVVATKPHTDFIRKGNNLYAKESITLVEVNNVHL